MVPREQDPHSVLKSVSQRDAQKAENEPRTFHMDGISHGDHGEADDAGDEPSNAERGDTSDGLDIEVDCID